MQDLLGWQIDGDSLFVFFLWLYACLELCFAALFYLHLKPKANRIHPAVPCRDYPKGRYSLMRRLIEIKEQTAYQTGCDPRALIAEYILGWFHHPESPFDNIHTRGSGVLSLENPTSFAAKSRSMAPNTLCSFEGDDSVVSTSVSGNSSTGTTEESAISDDDECSLGSAPTMPEVPKNDLWTVRGVYREGIDDFLAWAFFGKSLSHMEDWERAELQECHHILKDRFRLVFASEPRCNADKKNAFLVPYRHTLEKVTPLHRPLIVYLIVSLSKTLMGFIMRWCLGFSRIVSPSTGLVAWWRPANKLVAEGADQTNINQRKSWLPLLFFHGIGPTGHVMYLPMILLGLANDGRAVLIFENPNISCRVGFDALSEKSMVRGIIELSDMVLGPECQVAVAGHSFGCCLMTWLLRAVAAGEGDTNGLHSKALFSHRIEQFILLDPVTVLLSDSDVLVNFLYSRKYRCAHDVVTRLLASSELFVEHYLRRHFVWYNSELILEDIPPSTRTLVVLSREDNIVPTHKVLHRIECFKKQTDLAKNKMGTSGRPMIDTICWGGVGHGACVSRPWKCTEISKWMRQHEER